MTKKRKRLVKQSRKERWKKGSKDTLLLKDIKDINMSFKEADAETARQIDSLPDYFQQ